MSGSPRTGLLPAVARLVEGLRRGRPHVGHRDAGGARPLREDHREALAHVAVRLAPDRRRGRQVQGRAPRADPSQDCSRGSRRRDGPRRLLDGSTMGGVVQVVRHRRQVLGRARRRLGGGRVKGRRPLPRRGRRVLVLAGGCLRRAAEESRRWPRSRTRCRTGRRFPPPSSSSPRASRSSSRAGTSRRPSSACVWGPPLWKLARWAGALPGLASLSGRCSCKGGHARIVGKRASAAAAEYPEAKTARLTQTSRSHDAEPVATAAGADDPSRTVRGGTSTVARPRRRTDRGPPPRDDERRLARPAQRPPA